MKFLSAATVSFQTNDFTTLVAPSPPTLAQNKLVVGAYVHVSVPSWKNTILFPTLCSCK